MTAPSGTVVVNDVHLHPAAVDYRLLREERSLRSVANVMRRDAVDFLAWPLSWRS